MDWLRCLVLQLSVTATFSLIRFISHPQRELNQTFLAEWVGFIDRSLCQGKHLYFFVHCPIEARSPGTVRSFQQLLQKELLCRPCLETVLSRFLPNSICSKR
ncbi:MAG: DUF72 domain-containing protein [Chroococcidiopsidaceae cyanobacterium CP_BM_RX_35]|nr:DUF72 domain-containing protein [Chroococcidiopsidaceae cyanobacterium CP_BM_RX_35]